jgi:hypothetical protein
VGLESAGYRDRPGCEEILISSGLHGAYRDVGGRAMQEQFTEEAYQRYGLSAAIGNSYIVRLRSAIP